MRLFLAAAVFVLAGPGEAAEFEKTGQEVVQLVRDHFYERDRAHNWADRHDRYAAGIRDGAAFDALTNRILDELGASHTRYYSARDPRFSGLRSIFQGPLKLPNVEYESIGADFADGGFVRVVFAGGPAEKAGLKRGDEVVDADGAAFHPVESFRGKAGRTVTLRVRRHAGEAPAAVEVVPRAINPKAEWLEAQRLGSRVVRRNGKSVAYVPLFSCAGDEHEAALRDAIADEFRDADALVLDFRDGWGGCSPTFLDLFNPVGPALTYVDRDGVKNSPVLHWRKSLVLLVNGSTRSGKEVVASVVKRRRLGTLVGTRTAGAVLAGRPFPLSDGTLLYLAVADIRVDDERLEGHGVEPDVRADDALPYSAGADPQLERALDAAGG